MDSYNRGYEEGIEGLGGKNSKVGSATLLDDSSILKDENGNRTDEAAGFYAIAYDTEDYGTVISYRGTNNATDYFRGWTVAAGIVDTFTQADETLAFYTAVTGKDYWEGAAEDVIVTGHSLGGGLAGRRTRVCRTVWQRIRGVRPFVCFIAPLRSGFERIAA